MENLPRSNTDFSKLSLRAASFSLVLVCAFAQTSAFAGIPVVVEKSKPLRLDQAVVEVAGSWQHKIISPNTNYPYRVATQMLTLKSSGHFRRELAGGTFAVRNTVTLLGESIFRGPETHYFGFAARPSLEWWPEDEAWYLYFSPGGGVGFLDSRGAQDGQGQDFTLNILIDGGFGIFLNERTALKVGVQFHHFSNGGQTDPNPGLNLIGPQLGLSVFF